MLAHNKVQGGNSQDHYQLPPPQQQPQRHEHRQFVHQHQLPEHEHDRFHPQLVPQAQAPQKRMYHQHQEDEHDRHYSVGQDPPHHHHLQHHARSHRQVDLSRPRSRDISTTTLVSSTIHPTIANIVSPMSPHRPRSHPYSLAPPPNSTMAMTTMATSRASSAYRSFSPVSSSSSSLSSSSSSSRNVSLSPGLESEATMHHHSRSRLVPSSPSHPHPHHHHLPCHHRHPSSTSTITPASRSHSAPRRADEMAEMMKREYVMEELSSDSMMDQCEPQREWSTSSSQHTSSPSPVMRSSSYPIPVQESSPPHQPHRSLQNHDRYLREDEEDQQDEVEDEKEWGRQLKQPSGDQYTHTSLSHQQHPRSSQRHWQPHRWEQEEQQQHNDRKREYNYCLEREQQQQREEHIHPPSPTSSNRNHIFRRGSGTTDSTTPTVTPAVLQSSSSPTLSSSTALLLPSSSSSSFSSASLTKRMADLCPPRKQQRSSQSLYPVPNSPNNATTSPPQHSSLLPAFTSSSTTSLSSSLPPLRPVASAAVVNSVNNDTTHAPSPCIPFALSLSSREKSTSGNSGCSLPPLPLPSITTIAHSTSSSTLQHQQTQPPPSPTTKRPIDVSEPKSYEYRSKAQRTLYERHPPSPINNNNYKNSRSFSTSPSSSPLSHASGTREHSAPLSPPPLHATTLTNRASFGSLRDYQSVKRQHSHIYQPQQQSHHLHRNSVQQQHHHHQEQQPHHRHQYPQQMSLPPTSSLSQYENENRLPLMDRPQHQNQSNQRHLQSYRHSYPQPGHRSGSTGLGLELPKLSSLAFTQRQTMEPKSYSGSSGRSSNGGSSGPSSSSNSVVFSFMPRPPASPSMVSHGNSQIMPSPSAHHHQQQQQLPLPGTEGMTVVRNDEGAIMVYNPITDAMTFRCELCPGESFGRIHDLKRHQASKHQEMTWPCDFCHRPFVRRDALLRHYTVKAARDDGLHPATHEVDRLLAARARAKMLY